MAIQKRKDVTKAEKKAAMGEYGDVTYADETNKKYPLDTPEHVRAAIRYFGMPKNREKYSKDDMEKMMAKMRSMAKKMGVEMNMEMSDSKKFRKQVLRYGKWLHPSAKDGVLEITPEYVEKLVNNFKKNPYVPVLRSHIDNSVAEQNPELIVSKNIESLEKTDKGMDAVFEAPTNIIDKYNDVSARIEPDYTDHETGEILGDVLSHVALVVNPFIKKLDPFVALQEQKASYVINLSDIQTMENKKSKVELEDEVKTEVETEVKETETDEVEVEKTEDKTEETTEETKETEEKEEAETEEVEAEVKEESEEKSEEKTETEESAKPTEETGEKVKETTETSDVQKKIVELEEIIAKQNRDLVARDAESRYVELSNQGKVTPAVKEEVIALYTAKTSIDLADGTQKGIKEILDSLFEKLPKIIDFEEKGVDAEGVKSDISPVLLAEMRSLPAHKGKTDEEWAAFIEKNKGVLVE